MCPFLSHCSLAITNKQERKDIVQLGCTSSRCWAEINDQFGEPLGSVRNHNRFGLHSCQAQMFVLSRFSVTTNDFIEEDLTMNEGHDDDPRYILDISRRKQQEDKDQEDLHKAVLVSNTVKAAEKEIKNAILQALFF